MKWTSIKERLPNNNERILANINIPNTSDYDIVIMFHKDNCFYPSSISVKKEFDHTHLVTHWMPLPEPPK